MDNKIPTIPLNNIKNYNKDQKRIGDIQEFLLFNRWTTYLAYQLRNNSDLFKKTEKSKINEVRKSIDQNIENIGKSKKNMIEKAEKNRNEKFKHFGKLLSRPNSQGINKEPVIPNVFKQKEGGMPIELDSKTQLRNKLLEKNKKYTKRENKFQISSNQIQPINKFTSDTFINYQAFLIICCYFSKLSETPADIFCRMTHFIETKPNSFIKILNTMMDTYNKILSPAELKCAYNSVWLSKNPKFKEYFTTKNFNAVKIPNSISESPKNSSIPVQSIQESNTGNISINTSKLENTSAVKSKNTSNVKPITTTQPENTSVIQPQTNQSAGNQENNKSKNTNNPTSKGNNLIPNQKSNIPISKGNNVISNPELNNQTSKGENVGLTSSNINTSTQNQSVSSEEKSAKTVNSLDTTIKREDKNIVGYFVRNSAGLQVYVYLYNNPESKINNLLTIYVTFKGIKVVNKSNAKLKSLPYIKNVDKNDLQNDAEAIIDIINPLKISAVNLVKKIKSLILTHDAKKVVISGYNFGGCLASLFGLILKVSDLNIPLHVVTFNEQPYLNNKSQFYYNSRLNIRKEGGFTYDRLTIGNILSVSNLFPGFTLPTLRKSTFLENGITDKMKELSLLCNVGLVNSEKSLFVNADNSNIKKIFPNGTNKISVNNVKTNLQKQSVEKQNASKNVQVLG